MTRRHNPHAQVVTSFVRIPQELRDGQVRCAACSAPVTLTPNGTLRRHKMPSGEDCAHRSGHRRIELDPDEVPPVQMPHRPSTWEARAKKPKPERPPSRLDVGGNCETCGKWIPGERRFCGQCSRRRDRGIPPEQARAPGG